MLVLIINASDVKYTMMHLWRICTLIQNDFVFHFHIADIKLSEIIFSVQILSLDRESSTILSLKHQVAL